MKKTLSNLDWPILFTCKYWVALPLWIYKHLVNLQTTFFPFPFCLYMTLLQLARWAAFIRMLRSCPVISKFCLWVGSLRNRCIYACCLMLWSLSGEPACMSLILEETCEPTMHRYLLWFVTRTHHSVTSPPFPPSFVNKGRKLESWQSTIFHSPPLDMRNTGLFKTWMLFKPGSEP